MSETYTVSLCQPTQTILQEIAAKEATMKGIALTYWLCIASHESTDWPKVNAAIVERWGMKKFLRIKQMAWKHKPKDGDK